MEQTEKRIHRRLSDIENKEKVIIDEQFGFREGHSTVKQVVRIVNDVTINYNQDSYSYVIIRRRKDV